MKLTAALAVALLAGSTQADIIIPLGDFNLSGGEYVTIDFELDGTLTTWELDFTFGGSNDGTWSADMLFGIMAPSGGAIEAGGYNFSYGFEWVGAVGMVGSDPGTFNHTFTGWASDMSGTGTWTMYVGNGYTFAGPHDITNVVFTLYGVIPAPGSLALLGLGALAMRRRR